MVTVIEETGSVETNTIGVFRTAATVKGGRRFSFGSLVVAGDRQGRVGLGYAKANEVPPAIEKAGKEAKKNLKRVTLLGNTIPHVVTGRWSSSVVRLIPASPGTGVVAGSTVRAVLEMAGVTDCMTKSYGSNNKQNLAKAVMNGLQQLRAKEEIARLRGVEIAKSEVDERIEKASDLVAPSSGPSAPDAPQAESKPQAETPKKQDRPAPKAAPEAKPESKPESKDDSN